MTTTINGYNINYKITGPDDGDVIVMLQGWGTSLDLYDFVAESLNDKFRFVQLDFPGFGESDEPNEPWNVQAYADFFCAFMQNLGIKKAALMGHSYGGRVIIKLVDMAEKLEAEGKSLPFEITKLVLIDSAGIMPERSAAQKAKVRRYKMLRNFLTSKPIHAMFPEVIDYWMSKQGSEDYRNASPMMKKCLVMAVNEDQRESLPKIKQETLLIWGSLDDATPLSDAKLMEELIPDAALIVFEGSGHYSFLEQPAKFRGIVRSYFGADAVSVADGESVATDGNGGAAC